MFARAFLSKEIAMTTANASAANNTNTTNTNTADTSTDDKNKAAAGAAPAAAAPAAPAPTQAPKVSAEEEEDGVLDSVRSWVREHPMTAMGCAALAGGALGAAIHHYATRSR
jgi:hypothetical protein